MSMTMQIFLPFLLLNRLVLGSSPLSTVFQLSTTTVTPTTTETATAATNLDSALTDGSRIVSFNLTSHSSPTSTSTGTSTENTSAVTSAAPTGADTTVAAPQASGTSAPIADSSFSPSCGDLWANKQSEDWLFTTLCPWANGYPRWPLSNLDYALNFTDPLNLPAINVSIYNESYILNEPITMSYAGARADGNADGNKAWWGGAFRNAILSSNSNPRLVDAGKGQFNPPEIIREEAGGLALQALTGMFYTKEDLGQCDKLLWESWLDDARSSPVVIRSKPNTSNGLEDGDRYFSVISFSRDTSLVRLWDPIAGGSTAYFEMDSKVLRTDVKTLWHLTRYV
ncbi:hypothetical protein I302_103233 [Kwoniella bestiolae CBS 10118]|uniref:Calpain catalytic domain-containing protein n=1 Tax=Kwoniella bestiolae CBS 10118 TaxID=1296100 RepID=A0A1B9G7T5_9TREE|nr:hypothetical protein I302_01932 [Kwoniella bestiolae CBS 10118]OCF27097.1 hypothetical protein I302_01932 [Kwoniella bestiolae CBS 10118]